MSALYNVSQLLKSEVGQAREYTFQTSHPLDLGEAIASDITGHVRFTLTNFGVLARGDARAELHHHCARCLEPFHTSTEIQFEEEYQPVIDIATGLPSKVPPSDTAFVITQNHTIDLSEALRQNFILAMEIIPVCKPDCLGLCPTCGTNRNLEECSCPPPEPSSPFVVLRTLLADSETE